jgi:LacI family transcriptional regulator
MQFLQLLRSGGDRPKQFGKRLPNLSIGFCDGYGEHAVMTKTRPSRQGRVSLAMVAAEAGVSVATVSRMVDGETRRASAETVERVQKLVVALEYRPNHVGRALRRRESRIVAMLAPNSTIRPWRPLRPLSRLPCVLQDM